MPMWKKRPDPRNLKGRRSERRPRRGETCDPDRRPSAGRRLAVP
ncbi:hypothetical protein AKJ09_00318 [Labilithrix luteola]|uniref:Uncharacterized protein n=1 Tax=Labilithrix luteola TaxID=1391654 RepID=A0A0K1PKL7_9BACT|nr:hypothetical protein AKJ09_00318 [Labilithrix luteola]